MNTKKLKIKDYKLIIYSLMVSTILDNYNNCYDGLDAIFIYGTKKLKSFKSIISEYNNYVDNTYKIYDLDDVHDWIKRIYNNNDGSYNCELLKIWNKDKAQLIKVNNNYLKQK